MKKILFTALALTFSGALLANDDSGPNPCQWQHAPKTGSCISIEKYKPTPSPYGTNKIEFKGVKASERGWPQSPEDARP